MNQFERKNIPVKELPSGDQLSLTLYRVTGTRPGPHVHIQASVHGGELQGNLVIMELLRILAKQPINGSITLIPMANPQATNTKAGTQTQGRYNSVTGNNWNRNYTDTSALIDCAAFLQEHKDSSWPEIKKAYKQTIFDTCNKELNKLSAEHLHVSENRKLNLLLQKIASSADIVLDLHTGPVACRYLYSAEYQKHIAPDLLAPYTLIIPNEFAGAMDEACFMPWIKLHKEMENKGLHQAAEFFSFTVELGSEEKVSSKEAREDCARLLYFLYKQKVLDENLIDQLEPGKWGELANYFTYYASSGGLFEPIIDPGQEFKKGDVLAKIHRPRSIMSLVEVDLAILEIKAIHDGVLINHTPTAAVSEGMEILQILSDIKKWN